MYSTKDVYVYSIFVYLYIDINVDIYNFCFCVCLFFDVCCWSAAISLLWENKDFLCNFYSKNAQVCNADFISVKVCTFRLHYSKKVS